MDFKIGDVVELKSGGPKMVISEISENGSAHCQWFDKAKHSSANFTTEILEPAAADDSQTLVRGQETGINVSVLMDLAEAIRSRQPGPVKLPSQSSALPQPELEP